MNPDRKSTFSSLFKPLKKETDVQGAYSIEIPVDHLDTLDTAYTNEEEDSFNYEFSKLPIALSFIANIKKPLFSFNAGIGSGEGMVVGTSFYPIQFIQIHTWLSSWIFGNHKIGTGITLQPIPNAILGYAYLSVNAYAIGCEGTCGLDAMVNTKVQGRITYFRHAFEGEILLSPKFSLFIKTETDLKIEPVSASGGIRFLL